MPAIEFVLKQDLISPKLEKLSDPALKTRILNAAGTVVASLAQRAFDEPSLRPTPWKPRKKSKATNPLLIGPAGTMRQSIHHKLTGNDVEIGTPVIYGATHQLGSEDGHTPARPFFPVKDDALTGNATEAIEDVVEAILGSVTGD